MIGGGACGREVLDLVEALQAAGKCPVEVIGFVADGTPDLARLAAYRVPHLGPIDALSSLPPDVGYVIAIGLGQARRRIDGMFRSRWCPTLIHPSSVVGRTVDIGPGCIVCAHSTLTSTIVLGRHVQVNINSSISHDCQVGDYATLSPRVALAGRVHVGPTAMLGIGAVVNPGVRIGAGAVIGSGAAVVHDVPDNTTVTGVPARPR